MPEPMSDERLDFSHYREIAEGGGRMPFNAAAILTMLDEIDTRRAEVRRLRRALRLSEASRGVPSGVGRD
jgi:hypothetical protein